jgi:signal transduction histidine kinase
VKVRQTYFQQAVLSKTEVEWEEVQKNEDGTTDHSLKRYSPILDTEGEIVIVIGYGFNITDIRRAEIRAKESDELVRSLTESVQEGIFRLSSAGELLFANNAFYSLFDPEIAFKLRTNEQDVVTNQIISYLSSYEESLKAKPAKWLEDLTSNWLISQRKTDDDEFIDGVIVDVSAYKRVQADLEQKNKELEKAYMELDKFVYSASHDLRAPLTSVLGLIKVMEGENAIGHNFGEALPYINMIKVSVERLDTFVREIIQYYRNNRTIIETISVNVAELVLEVYELIRHLRPDLNIDLQIENLVDGPIVLDKPRLNIILNNLISNAVKYHSTDGGYVQTSIKIQNQKLVIQVTDNGPGIHPDHHERLFDMFYRVGFDSSGSGLGLYIVYETVKKMDGNITLSSTLGVGTSFTVVLPLVS